MPKTCRFPTDAVHQIGFYISVEAIVHENKIKIIDHEIHHFVISYNYFDGGNVYSVSKIK